LTSLHFVFDLRKLTKSSRTLLMKIRLLRLFGITLLTSGVFVVPLIAQDEVFVSQVVPGYTPHFFMAILGGVILAIGFQILLTSLSVATGISLIGDVEKKGIKAQREKKLKAHLRKGQFERDEERFAREKFVGVHDADEKSAHEQAKEAQARRDEMAREEEEDDDSGSVMVAVSSAVGIWTVVTASISLFFATLLAVRLSLVGSMWMGITLGLIIWAAFFATMTYLEIKSVSTLIGGVFGAALSGLRSSFSAARGMLTKSPEEKVMKSVEEVAGNLREEFSEVFDEDKILEKIDGYVENLKPQPIDFARVKEEVLDILRSVHLEEHVDLKEGVLDRETFIRLVQDQPHFKKEDVQKLSGIYDEISETLRSEQSGTSKLEEIAGEITHRDKEEVHETRNRIEEYLRKTGREELDPEKIKADIDQMFADPKSSPQIVMNRLKSIDRDTIVAALSQRDDISAERAEKIVSSVEGALDFVRGKVSGLAGNAKRSGESVKKRGAGMAEAASGMPAKVEGRLRDYFNSLGRSEFDYDRMRLDFERMLHDPKATAKILRARWKMYDRDSLKTLLLSRPNMSEERAERIVERMEEAKDNLVRKATRVDSAVRQRLEEAREMALHEAENVRKASAVAAWWMVGTAVISGAFAALGAILAISG